MTGRTVVEWEAHAASLCSADLIAELRAAGLPDEAVRVYRRELRARGYREHGGIWLHHALMSPLRDRSWEIPSDEQQAVSRRSLAALREAEENSR